MPEVLPLTADQFGQFFAAVHNDEEHTVEPFLWQLRLAADVLTSGFPEVIRVPTACGKTSVLDMAVFDLAMQAEREPRSRTAARRICFVVDRRLVVDDVSIHAWKIRNAVLAAMRGKRDEPVLRAVAERLACLAAERDEPLRVVRLRGGVYRDDGWSADPLTPSILVSTVDQIGSRLLFRGYGVSRCSRPLQAGLLAFDTRVILDEAHLSNVFAETLERVRRFQEWAECAPLPASRRVGVVRMSATAAENGRTFELREEEKRDKRLASRLDAKKPAELIPVPVEPITKQMREKQSRKAHEQERKSRERMVQEVVHHAKRLASQKDENENRPRVVGIVVNRVATARQVFEKLRKTVEGEPECDVILLTGRIRPYDRDRLLDQWLPSMKAGRENEPDRSLFVVATQTVEVGANLDFDALVTEAAPLDALRQRFGRLDRLGKRHERNMPSPACILIRSDQTSKSDNDPVYGSTIAETWKWLTSKETASSTGKGQTKRIEVDFGIEKLDPKLPKNADKLRPMLAPQREAPILFPAHLHAWVQTDPVPVPDPDVAPFLHGLSDAPADVQVVWRADLNGENERSWTEIVSLMPPRTREALPVPVYEVRAWLKGQAEANIADIEGVAVDATSDNPVQPRRALRWRGPDDAEPIGPDDIRPGDTIVVPASYGGGDEFGWHPTSRKIVEDIAEPSLADVIASYPDDAFRRPKLRFRLHPALLPQHDQATYARFHALLETSIRAVRADGQDPWPSIRTLLDRLQAHLPAPSHRAAVVKAFLNVNGGGSWQLYPDESGIVLSGALSVDVRREQGAGDTEYEEPEDDEASFVTGGRKRKVLLSEHSLSVKQRAEEFARACGLSDEIAELLGKAGWWHDQGKRDRRFQAWLHGSELMALAELSADRPLAKSGRDPKQWQSSEAFGYPRGSRHEFVSVRVFEETAVESGKQRELIRFLIGIHHGHGRPFPPVLSDPTPIEVSLEHHGRRITTTSDHRLYRIDGGWVDLFWGMVRQYGWWGIAYLEALLITADRSVSAREQRGTIPHTQVEEVNA
jgi:CRISPR-associated endonuclease/helicase Cas3